MDVEHDPLAEIMDEEEEEEEEYVEYEYRDTERFTTNDNIMREEMYLPIPEDIEGVGSVMMINLTASCWKPGATGWPDLLEPYNSQMHHFFNAVDHLMGNKRLDRLTTMPSVIATASIVPKSSVSSTTAAAAMASAIITTEGDDDAEGGGNKKGKPFDPRKKHLIDGKDAYWWYGRLRDSDLFQVHAETLFYADSDVPRANGIRVVAISKILAANGTSFVPVNEILDKAFQESFKGIQHLRKCYADQYKQNKPPKSRGGGVGKKGVLNGGLDLSLPELYKFTEYDTPRKFLSELVRPYFTRDPFCVQGEVIERNDGRKNTEFNDTRNLSCLDDAPIATGGVGKRATAAAAKKNTPAKKQNKKKGVAVDDENANTETEGGISATAASPGVNVPTTTPAKKTKGKKDEKQEEEKVALPLFDLFSMTAAMFYNVRHDGVLPEQYDIYNYVKDSNGERIKCSNDVRNAYRGEIRDCQFKTYYNPSTTYRIPNAYLSPEIIFNAVLPHRLTAELPLRKMDEEEKEEALLWGTAYTPLNLKKKKKYDVVVENFDGTVTFGNTSSSVSSKRKYGGGKNDNDGAFPANFDFDDAEAWLAKNDPDGRIQARILLKPSNQNVRMHEHPMGLHLVHYNPHARDILEVSPDKEGYDFLHGVTNADQITTEINLRFVEARRDELIQSLHKQVAAVNRPYASRVLLAFIDNAAKANAITNGVLSYRVSTPPFVTKNDEKKNEVVASSNKDSMLLDAYNRDTATFEEEQEIDLDDDDEPSTVDIDDRDSATPSPRTFSSPNTPKKRKISNDGDDVEEGEEERMDVDDEALASNENKRRKMVEDYAKENGESLSIGKQARIRVTTNKEKQTKKKTKKTSVKFKYNSELDSKFPYLESNKTSAEAKRLVAAAAFNAFVKNYDGKRSKTYSVEDVEKSGGIMGEEGWKLLRDVYLRLNELNKIADCKLDNKYFDGELLVVKPHRFPEYQDEKRNLHITKTLECWDAFFNSDDVSFANKGIRSDFIKASCSLGDGMTRYRLSLPVRQANIDVRPYHQYKIWTYAMFNVIMGLHYNYKNMAINYWSKFHHCRYYFQCNNPKLNCLNHGDGAGGKSFMLQGVKYTCPTQVGDMVTSMTAQAFNIDRNQNDMLIIMEEMQDRYLGVGQGGRSKSNSSGGSSGASENDALNYFKSRLTNGIAITLSFFEDEANGNARDMKYSRSSCQGNYLVASNVRIAEADAHLISRFMLISVPRATGDTQSAHANNHSSFQMSAQHNQKDIMFEQHRDIHRIYYMVECMVKANVLGDETYGVMIDGANIMIDRALNTLQRNSKISINNKRKRNDVLEMARCMCISFAVWNALTSPILRYLQYDPVTGIYIGFNPRVLIDGIFPFLIITKDMIIDALSTLSGIWQHDHLRTVLTAIVNITNVRQPGRSRFRTHLDDSDHESATVRYDVHGAVKKSRFSNKDKDGGGGGGKAARYSNRGQPPETRVDCNYVCITGSSHAEIYKTIAKNLGDLQISANDVEKIVADMRDEETDVDLPCYGLSDATPEAVLILDIQNENVKKRPCAIIDWCPTIRQHRVCFLVAYLKDKLADMLPNDVVQDLRLYMAQKTNNSSYQQKQQPAAAATAATDVDKTKVDRDGIFKEDLTPPVQSKLTKIASDEQYTINLIAYLKTLSTHNANTASEMIKALTESLENHILEKTDISTSLEKCIKADYLTLLDDEDPCLRYGTGDHPSTVKLADAYPPLAPFFSTNQELVKDVSFHETMKTLKLTPKETGRIIVTNNGFIPPSAQQCLSIYDPNVTENGVMKLLNDVYNNASAFILVEDIDYSYCKALLARLAYPILDQSDVRMKCINYPPYMYQTHIDHGRARVEIEQKALEKDLEEKRAAVAQGDMEIVETKEEKAQRRRRTENMERETMLKQIIREYPLNDMLDKVCRMGKAVRTAVFHLEDEDCVTLGSALSANCNAMYAQYGSVARTQSNADVLRFAKSKAQKPITKTEAIKKLCGIVTNKLAIPAHLKRSLEQAATTENEMSEEVIKMTGASLAFATTATTKERSRTKSATITTETTHEVVQKELEGLIGVLNVDDLEMEQNIGHVSKKLKKNHPISYVDMLGHMRQSK